MTEGVNFTKCPRCDSTVLFRDGDGLPPESCPHCEQALETPARTVTKNIPPRIRQGTAAIVSQEAHLADEARRRRRLLVASLILGTPVAGTAAFLAVGSPVLGGIAAGGASLAWFLLFLRLNR